MVCCGHLTQKHSFHCYQVESLQCTAVIKILLPLIHCYFSKFLNLWSERIHTRLHSIFKLSTHKAGGALQLWRHISPSLFKAEKWWLCKHRDSIVIALEVPVQETNVNPMNVEELLTLASSVTSQIGLVFLEIFRNLWLIGILAFPQCLLCISFKSIGALSPEPCSQSTVQTPIQNIENLLGCDLKT